MPDYKAHLTKLHHHLNILQEREAKHAGHAPLDLLNWIDDHKEAITLTEQAIAGEIDDEAWRAALKSLRVSLDRDELEAQQAKLHQTLANLADLARQGLAVTEAQAQVQQQLAAIQQQLDLIQNLPPATLFDQRQQQVTQQINIAYHAGLPQPATLDEATALAHYLRHVIESNRRLQLQGIRSAGQLVSIDLEQVYITLTATEKRTVTAEEAWLDETAQLAPGEARRLAHLGANRPRETITQVKVKVQEALAAHPRLVVLGDPGSGKTTLLRYLALTFARDLRSEAGLVKDRLDLTEQRLPLLLPLRDFARYLEAHHPDSSLDGPKLLLDYLRTYFANQDMALPERFFAGRLQRGECAVLLDGVDEVAAVATRHRVARIIERFTLAYPANRYLVSSRLVGYTGSARLGEDYAVTRVRDFSQEDIERFVTSWNRAVETVLAGGETPVARQAATRQTEALLKAIQNSERVRELAVNPLLLTVIALVQRYRAQLPERRTELYEEAIEVLLGKWDEAKGLAAKTLMAGRELDAGDRRSLLEPVALWMMEQQRREIETRELRQQLGRQFYEMVGDGPQAGQAVADFLRLINERSGLLTERGQGVYSFSHLTFQEHLAARAVADRPDYIPYTLARLGEGWWREVILLEAGYLSTQGKRRGTALIQAIMNHKPEPEPYHNLVLAAECLRDVGLARIEGDLWQELQQRLRREFERPLRQSALVKRVWQLLGRRPDQYDAIRRRAVAAEALARIESGGPGTQPAFWRLPYGEPVWVEVPAGEFWLGSDKGREAEKPVHQIFLETFKIARVPITNAQYQFFVEATGHQPPRHWEDGRLPRGLESHPVVNVTWHDALAYCRWLAEVTGQPVTLPTEAQWEKAARGHQDHREYPWGNEWDKTKCDAWELGLGETTPVGIFPDGASPYGCLDMAGNVWEWTSSLWGQRKEDKAELQYSYPYDPTDGRENLEAGDDVLRVVRGGSFDIDQCYARCAARYWFDPHYGDWFYGFRVVVSPISPPLPSETLPSDSLGLFVGQIANLSPTERLFNHG
jgi:formylglycine-generating enzyme required for sulfatase activity